MLKTPITLINKLGLHARASAKFVRHAGRYASKIELIHSNKTVNGKSIMGIMMLAARKGTELILCTEGPDEQEAADDLVQLVSERFGESE